MASKINWIIQEQDSKNLTFTFNIPEKDQTIEINLNKLYVKICLRQIFELQKELKNTPTPSMIAKLEILYTHFRKILRNYSR